MNEVIMMAMQCASSYAEKHLQGGLLGFEALMYEKLCALIQTYSECHTTAFEKQQLELNRDLLDEKKKHQQHLEETNPPKEEEDDGPR